MSAIVNSMVVLQGDAVLTAAANKGRIVMPHAGTILEITACTHTAPAGASAILDINKNGTTIFTTQANRPTVAAGSTTGTVGTPEVVDFADGDVFTVDCDQIGSSTAGTGFTVAIVYAGKSSAVGLDEGETLIVS
jgi:hypothetical protein